MTYRTEYNMPEYYTYLFGSVVTVNTLCWINVKGHPRRKAVGVLSRSVPVRGESCWYS